MGTIQISGVKEDGKIEEFEIVVEDIDGVVSVNITDTSFVNLDLNPLRSLTNLQELDISENEGLASLDRSPLSSLTNLKKLYIKGNIIITSLD